MHDLLLLTLFPHFCLQDTRGATGISSNDRVKHWRRCTWENSASDSVVVAHNRAGHLGTVACVAQGQLPHKRVSVLPKGNTEWGSSAIGYCAMRYPTAGTEALKMAAEVVAIRMEAKAKLWVYGTVDEGYGFPWKENVSYLLPRYFMLKDIFNTSLAAQS